MRIKHMMIQQIPLIDQKILPAAAISNMWQQERRSCSVMLEIKGLKHSAHRAHNPALLV